jgi:hypothetical protein
MSDEETYQTEIKYPVWHICHIQACTLIFTEVKANLLEQFVKQQYSVTATFICEHIYLSGRVAH